MIFKLLETQVLSPPCGIATGTLIFATLEFSQQFLMYHVELKTILEFLQDRVKLDQFLMHRVELKVWRFSQEESLQCVPNAPCGVENVELKKSCQKLLNFGVL